MPRKEWPTQDLNPPKEATNDDVIDTINNLPMAEIRGDLDEANRILKNTHLGHEVYLWGAEVDEE